MAKKPKVICNEAIEFGDDYGDNSCTFRCELEMGHKGEHRETGVLFEGESYGVSWQALNEKKEKKT